MMLDENIRQVVKIGSDAVVNDNGTINLEKLTDLAKSFRLLQEEHSTYTAFVFSGYVKAGKLKCGDTRKTAELSLKELHKYVMKGREIVFDGICKAFNDIYNIKELLYTYDELCVDEQYHISIKTDMLNEFNILWQDGIMPGINYDDCKDYYEIQKDNDQFATFITVCLDAQRLIILGNYDELYSDKNNPKTLIVDRYTPLLATGMTSNTKNSVAKLRINRDTSYPTALRWGF